MNTRKPLNVGTKGTKKWRLFRVNKWGKSRINFFQKQFRKEDSYDKW